MIPSQNLPDVARPSDGWRNYSVDEVAQHIASNFSQGPCLFEHDCLYYPDIARGVPMFRINESNDSSPAAQSSVSVRDSFGEGVYIGNNRSDGLCSADCHCHRLGPLDFAFIVSKHPTYTKIEVRNEALQNILIDVVGSDERRFQYGPPVWDGAQLSAQYEGLEARLRAVIRAPVGSVDTQAFLPLRLLVDGFLGQELERSLPSPRQKDPSYFLRDVFPQKYPNRDLKLLEAARKGNIRRTKELLDPNRVLVELHMIRLAWGPVSDSFNEAIREAILYPILFNTPRPRSVNVDAHDEHGNTALIHAAFAGHLTIAKELVYHGANIYWANDQGETALHKAAKAKHIDLVCWLIQSGADIHAEDNSGATPVHSWSSWAHGSSRDLKQLMLTLRENRERRMTDTREWVLSDDSNAATRSLNVVVKPAIESTMDDYQNLVSKPDRQPEIKNIKEAKAAMRGFFIQQYNKVRQHKIFERVRGRFPNSTRAWQFGMEALEKISYGYLPHEFGMTMAFLCVCKAVSLTLHTYGPNSPSDQPPWAYHGEFEESLSRCLPLLHGDDGVLFAETVRSIWNVQLHVLPPFCLVDYYAMFNYVERLTSDLIDAVERLSSPPTISAERRNPNQVQQGTDEQEPPPPNDPDPGDPCIGIESNQHNRTAVSRGARPRKSLLWVELMASSIFRILLLFLLWLVSLHMSMGMVQSAAIGAAEWPIDADAQNVVGSAQSCFADSLNAQQPLSIPSPAPEQDVIMSGQGYDDRYHRQHLESPALSSSSGGVPGLVHESRGSSRHFACLERNCKKRFTRKDNLDRHFKNHHGPYSERKRPCKACGKDYNAQYLSVHKCNPSKPFKRRSRTGH